MRITVNGVCTDVPEGTTAEGLVEIVGMNPSRVAVEVDGDICPRARRGETVLKEGQTVEIVGFVGGG